MSPRSSTVRPFAGAAQDGDEAGGRGPLAQLQRQAGQRRADLGGGLRAVEAELRLGVDGAAQRDGLAKQRLAGGGPEFAVDHESVHVRSFG